MFCFFVNGLFSGYWSNVPGDVFFSSTCLTLGFNEEITSMVYFPDLKADEVTDTEPTIEYVKVYLTRQVIPELVISTEPVEEPESPEPVEPSGEIIITNPPAPVYERVLTKEISSIKYVVNGLMLIPC